MFVRDRLTGTTEQMERRLEQGAGGFGQYRGLDHLGWPLRCIHQLRNQPRSGDTNGYGDIFVRDRRRHDRTRESRLGRRPGIFYSIEPSITSDGRYVSFFSISNFVPGDTNGVGDVFVRDRQSGSTERVSVSTTGAQGDTQRVRGDLGRWAHGGILERRHGSGCDRHERFQRRLRARPPGRRDAASERYGFTGNSFSEESAISADGNVVAFKSNATDLITGDTNSSYDVYAYDRRTGSTERVSVSELGAEGNGPSQVPSLSGDGRYVAFDSQASNLVWGDTNGPAMSSCTTASTGRPCVSTSPT